MSEKRFRANFDVSIYDSETEEYISVSERGLEEIAKRMNEQQATIEKLQDLCGESDGENAKLRIENKQLRQERDYWKAKFDEATETFTIDEKLYAQEIRRLNKEAKEVLDFKSLGGDY